MSVCPLVIHSHLKKSDPLWFQWRGLGHRRLTQVAASPCTLPPRGPHRQGSSVGVTGSRGSSSRWGNPAPCLHSCPRLQGSSGEAGRPCWVASPPSLPSSRFWRQMGGHLRVVEASSRGVVWGIGYDGTAWVYTGGYGGGCFQGEGGPPLRLASLAPALHSLPSSSL